jgi:hypothetical protein
LGPKAKENLAPPPPILQIMILKLSSPRCVISKESVQQKWIDEVWFRKQLSTCLFVWTLNYNSWALGCRLGWHPPPSLSGSGPINRRTSKKENNMSLLEGGINTLYTSFFSLVMWQSNIIIGKQCLINYLTTTRQEIRKSSPQTFMNSMVNAYVRHNFFRLKFYPVERI